VSVRDSEKRSPVTGATLGTFTATSDADVHAAVARARAAFPGWRDTPLRDRLRLLLRLNPILQAEADALASTISTDTGKPLLESLVMELLTIPVALDYYAAKAPAFLERRRVRTPLVFQPRRSYVEYAPMGVIAVIAPWNYPFQLAMLPTLSALIAGNTVVLKPSEVTPLVGKMMAELFERLGLPPGVVEVCPGDGQTGAALCAGDVDKIFFTGSVATGRNVMASAATRPIPVELELGGKDPMIVCHDAPVERAARAAAWGGLVNAGQMCISVERVYVVDAVYDAFVDALTRQMRRIRVGPPEDHADMGPLTFAPQLETITRQLEDAVRHGARIVLGGEPIAGPGRYFAPTLVVDVRDDMALMREETFGPVIPVMRVRDEAEALERANAHEYGLTGSIWTRDTARGLALASRLEVGHALVNDVLTSVGNIALPFGGIKRSGIGRYHGADGLRTFCNQKSIMVSRGLVPYEPFWFPYAGKHDDIRTVYDRLTAGHPARAAAAFTRLLRRTRGTTPPSDTP
jgi:acyl-CoA reductase-like NAD-dependent aldehyde dehydrogenase